MIIVAFLILMTLGFEFAKDMAEEAVPREMRPVLGQIFSEFTVLGFMAMVTYFMIQANVLAAASSLVYHDPEHLVHLFEKVHFDLFFVMMAFAAIAVWLLLATFAARRKWLSFERFAVLHSKHVQVPAERRLPLGARVVHKKHGLGTITQILHDRKRVVRFDSGGEHRYNEHSWSKLANAPPEDEAAAAPAPVPEEASPPAAAKTSALDALPASQALLRRASERQAEALAQASGTASGKTSGNASGTASVDYTAMPEEYPAPAAAAPEPPPESRRLASLPTITPRPRLGARKRGARCE